MAQKIIIDADPGIGDAFAVLTALVDPSLEVLGLTGTAGSVCGKQATRNLQYLTDLVDPLKHPRIGENDQPGRAGRAVDYEIPTRHNFFGPQGLGDVEVETLDLHSRRDSAKLISDLAREFPHEVRLLTLGPLSNVAAACDLDPELPELLESIVVLGGVNSGNGDVTAVSEFNIWADPESAATVFGWPTTKTMVPLDISALAMVTFEDVDALNELTQDSRNGAVLQSMLQFSVRVHRQQLACEGIPLHGVAAVAVAARAEAFGVEAVHAKVETTGQYTRGMTVIDRRPGASRQTNVDLVTSIDPSGVIDYFLRSFRRAAG